MHNNTHRGLRSVKLDSLEETTTSYLYFFVSSKNLWSCLFLCL